VVSQDPLDAAQADAVSISQEALRNARAAVSQKVRDDLLAEPINKPPTTPTSRMG
jgi:hypothetical protein